MAVAFQAAYQMKKFSFPTQIYTASFSTLMIFREIGPVLTALLVAGRVGASITAELGTMQITQQIDALRAMAANPVRTLVVPRFIALVIGLPLLTIYGDAIGVFGGYLVGVTQLGLSSALYIQMATEMLAFKDLWTGLVKALVFAVIIAIISCYQGFRTEGGAEGVGRATTWSVVATFTLIIAADSFFTAIFYFAGQ
jgi:phospholipid/cholesterol/gamma-HCH transport system permease protein